MIGKDISEKLINNPMTKYLKMLTQKIWNKNKFTNKNYDIDVVKL